MRTVAVLVLFAALAPAQDLVTRGADVFNKTCATGYCHGLKGAAAGAPRLAARGFDEAYITQVVRTGISGTPMPGFATVLPPADMAAVIAYVANLNGVTAPPARAAERGPAPKALPTDAARGRQLFFDATRGFGRCSSCHQVDGIGIAVTDPISKVPDSASALRELAAPHVSTASIDGESFPALIVSKGATQTKLYDLTKPPPVLLTLASSNVQIKDGSGWRHATVMASYRDEDLEAILVFLRAVVHP